MYKAIIVAGIVGIAALAGAAHAQTNRERIVWNHPDGYQTITFYDAATSSYTAFKTYQLGTNWRFVGVAGNRLLWQEQASPFRATVWKIDDQGNWQNHVQLHPPAAGYKARSIALATTAVGDCFQADGTQQRYWVLWEKDVPGSTIYVSWVYGGGSDDNNAAGPFAVAKPSAIGTKTAIGLTPIYGGDLAVLFAQDSQRSAIWTIALSSMSTTTMSFNRWEWMHLAHPHVAGSLYVAMGINAHNDASDGPMVQILFNDAVNVPNPGRALVVNVRETYSSPFGRSTAKRELWTHTNAAGDAVYSTTQAGYLAVGHTINTILPSQCR